MPSAAAIRGVRAPPRSARSRHDFDAACSVKASRNVSARPCQARAQFEPARHRRLCVLAQHPWRHPAGETQFSARTAAMAPPTRAPQFCSRCCTADMSAFAVQRGASCIHWHCGAAMTQRALRARRAAARDTLQDVDLMAREMLAPRRPPADSKRCCPDVASELSASSAQAQSKPFKHGGHRSL